MVQSWPQTLGLATMVPYRSCTQYNHQLLTANGTSRPNTCKTINPHTTRGLILSGEPSSTCGATNHLQIIHLHCKQGSIDASGNAGPHTTSSPHKVLYVHCPTLSKHKCPTHWDQPPWPSCPLYCHSLHVESTAQKPMGSATSLKWTEPLMQLNSPTLQAQLAPVKMELSDPCRVIGVPIIMHAGGDSSSHTVIGTVNPPQY